ncbi:glycosyltransferase family 39 protein [Hydrogenophaga pseudoflava]|uniref:glycosyltransferase family 39 protein n=1 Tax=Hydrogenophaga pseudoflava TaxID=47421 RepID=UPI0027E4B2C7|nr:glycosyltransferase family 39 protein [Hydrogenophaga pseudoflava]MDQ7746462.1 glycosyltransferase family 39 protein [Hydrogenophaga pseudoflava]
MALAVGIGWLLRGRQYLFNRSLWLDEAYLAVNFLERDLGQLLLEPLSNGQVAPLGFLALTKLLTALLGVQDWTLRLQPLAAGVLTLLAAAALARRTLSHGAAQATFVGLLALSPVLVYYSSEFKQYQNDVLATVGLLWLAARFDLQRWPRDGLILAVAGAFAIWWSHPSLFVLAGVGLVLWSEAIRQRQRAAWLALTGMGLLWLLAFALHHTLVMNTLAGNRHLLDFWKFAYAPLPPVSPGDWRWYLDSALALVYLAMRHVGVAHHGMLASWFDGLNMGLLALSAAGSVALAWRAPRIAAIGLAVLLATLVASALHLYPLRSRPTLFLVPLVHLGLAATVQAVLDGKKLPARQLLAMTVTGFVLLVPAAASWKVVRKPHNDQDMKGALLHISGQMQAGDGVVIDSMSHKAFNFYSRTHDLSAMPVVVFRPTPNQHHDAIATVRRLCGEQPMRRSWVIVTHRLQARASFLEHMASVAQPLQRWSGQGAAALLHDFGESDYCRTYTPPTRTTVAPPSAPPRQ